MKKKIIVFFATLIIGSATFAQNHTFGIDFALGFPIGFTTFTPKEDLGDVKIRLTELDFGMKIQTYCCFLFKGTLGLYASAGFGVGLGLQTEKYDDVIIDDGGIIKSGNFMFGPALGVNAGRLRFQTGIAFHILISKLSSFLYEGCYKTLRTYGIALTPQVRFTADKRCSFVVGLDFTIDFPKTVSDTDSFDKTKDVEYEKGIRFGYNPYLGIGINFGR